MIEEIGKRINYVILCKIVRLTPIHTQMRLITLHLVRMNVESLFVECENCHLNDLILFSFYLYIHFDSDSALFRLFFSHLFNERFFSVVLCVVQMVALSLLTFDCDCVYILIR